MPVAVSYPGVYIQEIPSGVRTITGVATSIALFIGWAPQGPTDKAARIGSFTEFVLGYGDLVSDSYLGYAVNHFFNNGGSDAYVLRLDSGGEPSTLTVGPFVITAKNAGEWGKTLGVIISEKSDAGYYSIEVYRKRTVNGKDVYQLVETFTGISANKANSRYAEFVLNPKSDFISVAPKPAGGGNDAAAAGGGDGNGGAAGGGEGDNNAAAAGNGDTGNADGMPKGLKMLAGGSNGTDLRVDGEFKKALQAACVDGGIADRIDLFNLLCVPGYTDATTLQLLQTFAKRKRALLIVDCAQDATVANVAGNLPSGPEKDYSAFYFPWVKAQDPAQAFVTRDFPPSGFVAGVMARTDTERGVWKAPAGTEAVINGASALSFVMNDFQNGTLNERAVNCLRTFPVYGNVVWGARTLHGDDDDPSDYKYVPIRRLVLFIEESLYRGTKWVVFEPNDEPLWSQIRLNVGAFMHTLFRQGAFQGSTPKDAYFVKCDKETNPQNDIDRGIVNIVVGFAPLKPAEFVIISIQQMAGQIQT